MITAYRSPTGNFDIFLLKLDNILSAHYSNKLEFIICGDVNINYLEKCDRCLQLDSLLCTYNLIGTVNFHTRIVNNSRTAIDNIYIHRNRTYTISPIINGLSDHDVSEILCFQALSIVQVLKDKTKEEHDVSETGSVSILR
jgi:hypothetical protein